MRTIRLAELSADRPVVLDGAVGSEIARLGGRMDPAAWSAVANRTHPEIVQAVHEGYLRAGADIVTANTFATARHVLAAVGLAAEATDITRRAVALARRAIQAVAPTRPVLLAGSMSNTVAWRPGTFSPDPRHFPTPECERANYRETANALAEAGVDLILVEMALDVDRASHAVEAAVATGLPVWIGLSASRLADGSLSSWDIRLEEPADQLDPDQPAPGTVPFARLGAAMAAFQPEVLGVMHSRVATIDPALDELRRSWRGPVMVYPEIVGSATLSPAELAAHGRRWAASGVRVIGGCCGTTRDHIAALSAALGGGAGPA